MLPVPQVPKKGPEKQADYLDEYAENGMMLMLDYMYDHFEIFQLLVDGAYGTKFQNFVESLVEIETEYTYKYMEAINFQGEEGEVITEEFIHIMTRAMFESMFEVVRHKMPKEKADFFLHLKHINHLHFFLLRFFRYLHLQVAS